MPLCLESENEALLVKLLAAYLPSLSSVNLNFWELLAESWELTAHTTLTSLPAILRPAYELVSIQTKAYL